MRQAHCEPTESEQMETGNQCQRIQMQGRPGFGMSALIAGWRNRNC
jgi:hypothetical protein